MENIKNYKDGERFKTSNYKNNRWHKKEEKVNNEVSKRERERIKKQIER